MYCAPGKKNALEYYLQSTYLITEQFRYGEVKRASETKSFKSMYEGTLENIKALADTLQRKIEDAENESKTLKLQNENLIVERENAMRNCERLNQLLKESQNAEEIYKKKSRDLTEANLALQRKIEDFEASVPRSDDYTKLRQKLQDCFRNNEQYKNKTKDLLFTKQKLERRNEEQIQKSSQEKNQLQQDLQNLRQDLERQNSKSQSIIEKRNEEIMHLKNALTQSQSKKEQIKPELSSVNAIKVKAPTPTDEVDKQISSKPSPLNLQIGDNFVRKIHTNLLQSSSGKEICYNCRKLENELKQKVREINEIRKDEADFKNTGIKEIPTPQEYMAALYLKEKNELYSKNEEFQRKNEKLTESLRSVQNELYEYKNPFGKPSYFELWKLHEEQKQQFNKSEKKVKDIEAAIKETQQKCANLEGNNKKLKEENEKKIKDCDKIQIEFDNIQTMLLKTQNGLAESKQREDTWKREETILRKMCKENNQQLIEKDDNIKKAEAILKEIQQKHLILQANNEKFLSENEENLRVKNLLTQTEASLKEAQKNYQNLQENNEKLSKENETLIKEIKENKISLTQYKESENKLGNNEADLRKMCEEIKQQLKEKEDKFKNNETDLQETHQKYRTLQENNKELAEEKEKLAKEIEEGFKERSNIEKEIEIIRKTFQGVQADLIQYKQKEEILKKTESEHKDLLQKYSSLGEKNKELIKANNEFVEDIRLNQSKYEDTQSQLKIVRDEFEAYKRNKRKEKDEEERRLKENEQIAANAERQYNETKEKLTLTSIKLNQQESVTKETAKHLEESSTFLKNQEEILKDEMSKIKQREVAIDEKEGNLLIKEMQIKKEEAACREKEENLKKIEADFGKSKNELMSQIKTLSEKNGTLQLEKVETTQIYQQLLKQFVQTQEELKETKKSLEEMGEQYKHQSLTVLNKEEALKGKKENDLLVKNIDDKNADLQEEFNNLKRQNENLLRQKEQGEAQIVELMQTGQRLQDEVKDAKQNLDESEKLLNIEFQKMKKLNEERKAAMEKCHYFERHLQSISDEKEDLLKKMNTLRGEVSVLQNTNNLLLKEKEEIENERSGIQEVLQKKNELTEEVSEQKIRIKNLLEERKKYFDTNEDMLEKYQLLQKENEQLGEKLNTTENNLQIMKSQFLEGNQRLKNELEESRKDLEKHIILSAKEEKEIERRTKTEFMTKEQTLTNKLREVMDVESNRRKEASVLRLMNSDLTQQMVKANQEFSRLKQDVENLRIVYEQEKTKMEDNFRNATSELNNEILALKEGNGKLEKEIKNILQRNQHLEKQIQEKSETIESKNKLVEKLNAELRSKHEEFDTQFAIKKKNWEDTESSLKKELTLVKQEVIKTEQEKGDLLQKCETLERELKNAQNVHEQYRQKGDEIFKNEAHSLENELSSLKDSNKKLEKALNDVLQNKLNLENEIQVLKTAKPTYEELSTRLRQIEAQVEERSTAIENKNKLLEEMERKLKGSDVVVEEIKTEFKIKEGELNVEINKSAKIQNDLQNEVLIFKQENTDLKKKVTETNQVNINLHHEHEIHKQDLASNRIIFNEQSQKNEESFKKETDRLENEISSLNDRTRELEVDLNDALQKKLKLEEEIQVIANKLKRYKNPVAKPSYEELSKQLEQTEAQLQEKSSALESKNQLIENSEFLAKNKEMEVTAKLTQISKAKTAETGEIIKQMKNEFKIKEDDLNSKISAYIESENNLQENISVLKLENVSVMEKMTKINQEHNKLRQELELLKLELNNKENVCVRQRQELEDISRRLTNDLNEISFLKGNNQKLENDIKTSANVNLKLENEIQMIRNDLRRYTNPTIKPSYEQLEKLLEEKQAIFERQENFIREREKSQDNFSKLEHALRNEIKELKQANASLIEERHAASKEKVKLLDEYEYLKRELEARKIAYEEELNRYEETFEKEENDLRNRISVLKRENGVLQRELDNALEEKHRLEELARTIQNKLKEKDALSEDTNKLIRDSEQLLFAKDEENRQLRQLIQQKNEILRSKEDEFRREMESFKHEKNLIFEKNRILETSYEQQQVLIREFEGKERSSLEEMSVLKNTNQRYLQDIEAMKIEMETFHQERKNIKPGAERSDIKNQLKKQKWVHNNDVQHPISKNIWSAITSIGYLEEIAAKLNTDDMKNVQSNLRKEATQMYGRKIRDLNMVMLKIINELDDADIRKQNEEFKCQLKLKHEDAERIESIFALPDTIKHIKSNFEGAIQKILNETEKNLNELKQAISVDGTIRYQSVIAQINAKYEEIVAMLSGELNRLQQINSIIRSGISDMPKETIADVADGRYVQESMKKINAINRNTRELELRVVKFRGTKDDKTYLDLNHKLMENIMQIDVIQVNGSEKIRERRREAVKYSSKCMEKLDANLIDKS